MRGKALGLASLTSLILDSSLLLLMALSFIPAYLFLISSKPLATRIERMIAFLFGFPIVTRVEFDALAGIGLLMAIYIALMAYMLVKEEPFFRGLRRGGLDGLDLSHGLMLSATFSSLAVITGIVDLIQGLFGLEVGELEVCNPIQRFFYISLSPITEEIGFRLSLIGLVGILVTGGLDRGGVLKALLKPKGVVKGDLRMHFVILTSSLLFAYLHLLGGWGPGKFSEAAITGYVLGRLYFSRGIGQAIMLHWAFNFFSASYHCYGAASGIPLGMLIDLIAYMAGAATMISLILAHYEGRIDLMDLLKL